MWFLLGKVDKKNPPIFGDTYFEWTVTIHNPVNQKLMKPTLSIEDARKLYLVY